MRFKGKWVIIACTLFSACLRIHRTNSVELGVEPTPEGDRLWNDLFVPGASFFVSAPTGYADELLKTLKEEIHDKEFSDTSATESESKIGSGLSAKSMVDKVYVKACLDNARMSVDSFHSQQVILTLSTCGLTLGADDAVSKVNLGGTLTDFPVKLTVRHIQLHNEATRRNLSIAIRLKIDQAGTVSIQSVETKAGFENLVDPTQYDMDLSYSGFEEALGQVGEDLNQVRKDLLISLLQLVQKRAAVKLEKSAEKSAQRLIAKFNEKKLGFAGLGISAEKSGVRVAASGRLTGLVGETDLGFSFFSQFHFKLPASPAGIECQPKFHSSHRNAALAASYVARRYEMNSVLSQLKPPPAGWYRSKVIVPKETLQNALWSIMGDQSECTISISPAGKNLGDFHLVFDGQPRLSFMQSQALDPTSPLRIQLQVPAMELSFTADVGNILAQNGFPLPAQTGLYGERKVYISKFKEFTYTVLMSPIDKSSLNPNQAKVKIAVENDLRYKDLSDISIDMLVEDATPTLKRYSQEHDLDALYQALATSLLNQKLGPYLAQNPLVYNRTDALGLSIDALQLENDALSVFASFEPPTLNVERPSANLSDLELSAGASAELNNFCEKLEGLQLPCWLGVASDGAAGYFDTYKRALPIPSLKGESWECDGESRELSYPGGDEWYYFVTETSCYRKDDDVAFSMERHYRAVPGRPETRENISGSVFEATTDRTTQIVKGLQLKNFINAMGAPTNSKVVNGAFTYQWDVSHAHFAITGFCWEDDPSVNGDTCKNSDKATVVSLRQWID